MANRQGAISNRLKQTSNSSKIGIICRKDHRKTLQTQNIGFILNRRNAVMPLGSMHITSEFQPMGGYKAMQTEPRMPNKFKTLRAEHSRIYDSSPAKIRPTTTRWILGG